MKAWISLNFGQILPPTRDLSEESMYNVVNTLAPSFLIRSSSFLQVTRTTIKSQMSSKFSRSDHGLRSKLPLSV